MRIAIAVGTRFPAFATSMGRVLLAGQSDDWLAGYLSTARFDAITTRTIADANRLRAEIMRIRRDGYALVDQELEEGLISLAAPIRDGDGRVIAAVNLSTQASRCSAEQLRAQLLDPLRRAADAIEKDLRATGNSWHG
jgi:IclR family pca regulon transcriptional regulator